VDGSSGNPRDNSVHPRLDGVSYEQVIGVRILALERTRSTALCGWVHEHDHDSAIERNLAHSVEYR
jgi:hypothetical protein